MTINTTEKKMPVYEYHCAECGQIEEAFQKISDSPLENCSHCQGPLKKLISQSSFHLKGSGWYATDYSNKKSVPGNRSGMKERKSPKPPKTASCAAPAGKKESAVKNKADQK
jgi:putative FmdB family regulatory protein